MSFDPVWWVIVVLSSLFFNIGIMIYFAYTKLDEAEAFLYDVNFISWYRNTFGTSFLGRHARLNAISMVVMMPGLLQRRGEISREAYMRLPPTLVKQIRALYFFLYANGFALACLYFFIR